MGFYKALFEVGGLYYKRKDLHNTMRYWLEGVKKDDPRAAFGIGILYEQQNDLERAILYFEKAYVLRSEEAYEFISKYTNRKLPDNGFVFRFDLDLEDENYELNQTAVCNADDENSGMAFEVHNYFNAEKKLFMKLYQSLGDMNIEPNTDSSFNLFNELQNLFNQKLHNIKRSMVDYDIKISVLIKTINILLSSLHKFLTLPRNQWSTNEHCDFHRLVFQEAICDYSSNPPLILENLRICDLYLRYVRRICLLDDELFTTVILDYSYSNVSAYDPEPSQEKSLEDINKLLDVDQRIIHGSCEAGWIERVILCFNVYIRKLCVEKNNSQIALFQSSSMSSVVEILIEEFKNPLDLNKIYDYIAEFKLSLTNSNIQGDLQTVKAILKKKIFSFIIEKYSEDHEINEQTKDELISRLNMIIDDDILSLEESLKDGKYKKKYLKYKAKYLKLKNK